MTNEEIRIKIAQAKGWTNIFKYDGPDISTILGNVPEAYVPAGLRGYQKALPNWPENIADAWELFEEMPTEKALKQYDAESLSWACFCDGEYTYEVAEREDTAPLAICAAWLAWDAARKEKK